VASWFAEGRRSARIAKPNARGLRPALGLAAARADFARCCARIATTPGCTRRTPSTSTRLKYAHGLASTLHAGGVQVHEHSRARSIEPDGAGWIVRTDSAWSAAARLAVCCGGYIGDFCPRLGPREPSGGNLRHGDRAPGRSPRAGHADASRRVRHPLRVRLLPAVSPTPGCCGAGACRCGNLRRIVIAKLLLRDLLRVYPQLQGVPSRTPGAG
jgi:glycine/D-amino acid oxidase-like deaminating enzyme